MEDITNNFSSNILTNENMLATGEDIIPFMSKKKANIVVKTKKTVSDLTIKFADLIVAAFGIVSALSFNSAIQSMFSNGGIFERFNQGGPWIVAIIITLMALAVGYLRSKYLPTSSSVKKL